MNYIEQFMKDNDLKINEEFYIKTKGYKNEWVRGDVKYHFDENYFLISEEDKLKDYGRMNQLLTGFCKIEKIPVEPKTVWDLKYGDKYYYLNHLGVIYHSTYDRGTLFERLVKEYGNAFLTWKEAEFEAERRKCESILLKYGTRDMMSLGDENNEKYTICYGHKNDCFYIDCYSCLQEQGAIYFESNELAQKAIDECGVDRLKKYVFNVKE